ncbi:hypothetical protein SAMN05216198_1406 [Halopseudomonas litoralis]|uniref:TonB C terminal n=1 Tax=Halopseudomonas litoralis TaxID=797277 RepID=A0A1H1Q7T5_9GAMM|nr:hypothetical protein [Halopseudomonas litoralis]SDS19562.1 hypothetical protein SAMN05216198_1406 [Halopseudomonas litoralis]
MSIQMRRPRWRRFLTLLGFMGGAAVASTGPEPGGTTDVHPSLYWDAYARFAGTVFQGYLDEETEINLRFHQFLHQQAERVGRTPEPVTLRVWLDEQGSVVRVSASPLGNAQADQDLMQILMAKPLPTAPPAGMPMPLLVSLKLLQKV